MEPPTARRASLPPDVFAHEVATTAYVIDDGIGSTGHPGEIAEDRHRRFSKLTARYGRDADDEIWTAAQQRVHEVWSYGRRRAISEGKW